MTVLVLVLMLTGVAIAQSQHEQPSVFGADGTWNGPRGDETYNAAEAKGLGDESNVSAADVMDALTTQTSNGAGAGARVISGGIMTEEERVAGDKDMRARLCADCVSISGESLCALVCGKNVAAPVAPNCTSGVCSAQMCTMLEDEAGRLVEKCSMHTAVALGSTDQIVEAMVFSGPGSIIRHDGHAARTSHI